MKIVGSANSREEADDIMRIMGIVVVSMYVRTIYTKWKDKHDNNR